MIHSKGVSPVAAKRERIAKSEADKLKTFKALSEAFTQASENQDVSPRTIELKEGAPQAHSA